jgi:Fur family peroxide stress response transcriptional regulator
MNLKKMQTFSKNKNTKTTTELFKKKCIENRLKITPQRSAVYQELLMTDDHPNAEAVYRRVKKSFPHISLDTVSRTLLTLNRIGIADVLPGSGEPKRFDAEIGPHHHFRCLQCNRLIDIYDDIKELRIPEELTKKHAVTRIRVLYEGICSNCKNKMGGD